ncbi:cobalamin biosynthesis protein CobW [Limnoraphis robusta Tam1]|jgi:cobalamin biosynthesis protein CobW|uniref:Cobalamin biosynthesis protein CobW n=1 Tax=Limnoraphis robusta CCNP1315 TaxID=3110306 RepID=A0ABU5U8Y2_9CYAN|nr:cobalamin biosynthesis protein CobW [Limnoraphis robusta]MCG5059093.1 cobalamin biosynthesis protein CobW [Limnoraphis sp. WC205]MEA5496530.1 cobalamin biosynthesis protein CobW [Limnoraphis robusta BA-68 BA1]MEA5522553.1 cobalamin biosynthesis protein CobW [Limnoraphis robusta CCNP1315]MEA5539759.1 cobalamin biosynthesis protein CobW [Limnoraphis robusta Tam1]MEA5545061.1 cobalamin biosynthesis protein CobW [Limnoraphis robusta CCNP1324]
MHKIPVTVVTGFLGAGKTTLVRHLLQNNQGRRIAVLVNEFGEMGIDGELLRSCQICEEDETPENNIVELTNGCLCCTVQEEFYPTMQELLKRRDKIDCILVETSGLALPKPLIQAFRWPEIRNSATVDGVLTVVDAQALAAGTLVGDLEALEAQRQADPNLEHETPIEELFEDQLACADLVLLTKTDLVDENSLTKVREWLHRELPAGVKIVSCQQGEIDTNLLLGFNAAVEDHLESRPSHHDHEEEHEHDDEINAVQFIVDQAFEPKTLIEKLQELVQQQEIYRIKGFVHVPNKPMRMVLQGVGNRFDSFYDRLWLSDELRQTRLVFIGRELNLTQVEQAILNG